jgi:hypothetical protein
MSRARVENLVTRVAQSYLLQDVAIGAELIVVESGVEFSDEGGTIQIGDTLVVSYLGRNLVTDVDELPQSDSDEGTLGDPIDNSDPEGAGGVSGTGEADIAVEDIETESGSGAHAQLVLAAPLSTGFARGTTVMVYPQTETKWVLAVPVEPGFEEAVWARIPHTMQLSSMEEGTREDTFSEQIDIVADPYGDFVVTDVYGQPIRLNSDALVDVPFPDVGPDGLPPEISPTPTVSGGIGSIYVTWPAISNADPVTYVVHISTDPGFTPSTATEAGRTMSTMANILTLPDGTKLQAGTVYYVLVVASDDDGQAVIPGNAASGTPRLASNAEISADYAYLGTLQVNQLTGGVMSAVVALAGQMSIGARGTSGFGAGVDINSSGITMYDSANKTKTFMDAATGNATFRGQGEFDGMTILGGLSVRGTTNEFSRGSETIIQEGITPSQVGPSVLADWSAVAMAIASNYNGYTLRWAATNHWEVLDGDGTTYKLERFLATGARGATFAQYTNDPNHQFLGAHIVDSKLLYWQNFESGIGGWNFNTAFGAYDTSNTPTVVTSTAEGGTQSLDIAWAAPPSGSTKPQWVGVQLVGLTVGKTYTFEPQVKHTGAGVTLQLAYVFFQNGSVIPSSTNWQNPKFTFVAQGANPFIGFLNTTPAAGQHTYVDNVIAYEGTNRDFSYFLTKLPTAGTTQYGVGRGLQSTDINDYARLTSGSGSVKPIMCSDGTYLYVADLQSLNNVRIYKYDPSTADSTVLQTNFETDATSGGGGTFKIHTLTNMNMIPDPSVEPPPGIDTASTVWTKWAVGGGTDAVYAVTTDWGRAPLHGSWQLEMYNGVGAAGARMYLNGPMVTGLKATKTYFVRMGVSGINPGWVNPTSGGCLYRYYNAAGAQVGSDQVVTWTMSATAYQEKTFTTTAVPAGATQMRLFPFGVRANAVDSQYWMADRFIISPVSAAYFDGNSANTSTVFYNWSSTFNQSTSEEWTQSAVNWVAPPSGTTGWSGTKVISATQSVDWNRVRIVSDPAFNYAVSSVNNVYRLKAKLLATNTGGNTPSGTVEMVWLNSSGKELGKAVNAWSHTDGATVAIDLPTVTGKPVSGTTQMQIRFTMADIVGATLSVDDITITQLHGIFDTPTTEANLTPPAGVTSLDALYVGNGDFGSKRYILALSTAAGQQLMVYSSAGGAATPSESFPIPSGTKGIAYDGTQFKSLSGSTLVKHESGTANIDSTKIQYAAFTWKAISPRGPYETPMSALATFTGGKRKRLTVTTAPINDTGVSTDPNSVGIYMGQATSPTVPAYSAMWLQGTPAANSNQLTVTTLLTSGTPAPNPVSPAQPFPAATPAWIHSARRLISSDPVWELFGDGGGNLGQGFSWDKDGVLQIAHGRLYSAGGINVGSGTEQEIGVWDTTATSMELRGGMTCDGRWLTVPVDGVYAVDWQCVWASNATGRRYARATYNGVPTYTMGFDDKTTPNASPASTPLSGGSTLFLPAGSKIGLSVYQASGGNLMMVNTTSYVTVTKIA